MRLRYILILLSLILLSGCSDIYILESDNTTNTSFWFEDIVNESLFNASANNSIPVLRYSDLDVVIDKRLSALDIVVQSGSSLYVGGSDGAKFTASILPAGVVGTFLRTVVLNANLIVNYAKVGTTFNSNINLDMGANSSAIIGASAGDGEGMIMQKFNANHLSPYRGVLASLKGNIDLMTSKSNLNTFPNIGNNKINIGFYQNIIVDNETNLLGYNNTDFIIDLNLTEINLNQETNIEENLYFKQLNSTEIPDEKIGYVAMYCKPNENCYIKESDGTERRLVDAGGGSIHLDESIYFNTSTIVLEHTTFAGSGNRYVCIDTNEQIFVSSTACN